MQAQTNTAEKSPEPQNMHAPNQLQRCLRPGDGTQAAAQAVSQAEQALEKLSVNFDDWMDSESKKLIAARAATKAAGYSEVTLDVLFGVAHDLKGQAPTLGYPYAADICASLCRLIDVCSGKPTLPAQHLDHLVDAVRAIVLESAKGTDHPKASALSRKLCDVTDDYLVQLAKRSAAIT